MTQTQNGGRKHKVSPEDARKALSAYESGKSFNEAAQSIGVSRWTLTTTLERLGLRLRYQKPKMLREPLRMSV